MIQFVEYSRRFEGWRGSVNGLPAWARLIVVIAALPGLILLALSVFAVFVSLAALFGLAVPAYRLVGALCRTGSPDVDVQVAQSDGIGRKQVDAKVVE